MFGTTAQKKTLDTLAAELTGTLASVGFQKDDAWSWKRSTGWKVDEIDLVPKGGFLKYILPSFRVRLPLMHPTGLGEMDRFVAQINVPRFLRPGAGPDFDIKVPSFAFRQKRFIRGVRRDILSAINWFDEFGTPHTAKENLKKYLKPGCPAYEAAVEYLDSLPNGQVD